MAALPRSPLVGRDRELGMLRTHLTAALGGQGRVVLIGGEAGIGKTTLTEAVCHEAAEHGARILVGRCFDLTEAPPFGPWMDLFMHARAETDPALPAAFAYRGTVGAVASQVALFQQVLDFLAALSAQRAVVLVLDDLHWADPASLDLVRFLGRYLGALPILLLMTYRSDELTPRHRLYPLLPVLVREASAARINLRPLHEADVAALVAARYWLDDVDAARLVTYLHERAEGNPFYSDELLRTLEEAGILTVADGRWTLGALTQIGVPPLLRQVIEGRLARLGEETQALLAIGAVIGQEVPLDVWAAVAGTHEAALSATVEPAVTARLLEETPDGTHARFLHALIRETLYESILPSRRRRMHGQIGETLAVHPDPDPDAVAYHFRQAGDARAAEWLMSGGERAQAAFAWLTAAERYEAALTLLAENGPRTRERGWLLYRIARLRRWESAERSVASLDAALNAAQASNDRALTALVRFTRGVVRYAGGHEFTPGNAELQAGLDAVSALSEAERERLRPYDPALAADPRLGLAQISMIVGRYRDVLAILEGHPAGSPAAMNVHEPATAVLNHHRSNLATAYTMLGHSAKAGAERAGDIAHFRATRNYQRLVQALLQELARVLVYETDDVAMWRRLAAECEDAFRQARAMGADSGLQAVAVPVLVLEGRWAEARALTERTPGDVLQRRWMEWSGILAPAHGILADAQGELARSQGASDEAWQRVRYAVPDGAQTPPGDRPFVAVQSGQRLAIALCLEAGDLPQARAWLSAYDCWLHWSGALLGQSEGAALWAGYYRRAGAADRAREYGQRALAHASDPRQPFALIAAHRLLGELAADAGRYDDAAMHLRESLVLADACATPYGRALTLLADAELRLATDEHDAARSLLDAVRAICEPLGAKPALACVDALMARLPAARSPSVAYPDSLTQREAEVLRLLASGNTSQEIADALFLSPRTIERYITTLYRKIDARGRADATAYALRHGLMASG